jgi:hypothetical protein
MADHAHAASVPTPVAEVEAGAADQQGAPDLVKKVTHEIATDDMFAQGEE